jgi:hypothetical protein
MVNTCEAAHPKGWQKILVYHFSTLVNWMKKHPFKVLQYLTRANIGDPRVKELLVLNLQAWYCFFGNVVGSHKDFQASYSVDTISKFSCWSRSSS